MAEDEFSESLEGQNKKEYLDRKREIIKRFNEKIENQNKFYYDSQIQEIEKDGGHRNMINLCVAPFIENGSMFASGYRYIRPAPLAELGEKNFDFLLFKLGGDVSVAIFGECKGGVSNIADAINYIKKQKEAVNKNLKLIKTQYLKISENTEIERVEETL